MLLGFGARKSPWGAVRRGVTGSKNLRARYAGSVSGGPTLFGKSLCWGVGVGAAGSPGRPLDRHTERPVLFSRLTRVGAVGTRIHV